MKYCLGSLLALALILATPHAAAQSVAEITPISFGLLIIPDNDTASTITVPLTGNSTHTGPVIPLTNGDPGRYQLMDLPASTIVDVSLSTLPVYPAGLNSGAIYFTIDSFVVSPTTVTTTTSGTAILDVGATLNTTGSGLLYTSGSYEGTLYMTVTLP